MEWVKLWTTLHDDPKLQNASDKAFRYYVNALSWCGRQESDGVFEAVGRPPKFVAELIERGLFEPLGDGRYFIHGWDRRQTDRTTRTVRSESARKAATARWDAERMRPASAEGMRPDDAREEKRRAEESTPPNPPSGGAYDDHPRFAEFWAAFPPPHTARRAAVRAFNAAVRKRGADPDVLIAAASRYAESPKVREGYVKAGSTWLNGDCWADDRTLPSPRNGHVLDTIARELVREVNGNGRSHEDLGAVAPRSLPR